MTISANTKLIRKDTPCTTCGKTDQLYYRSARSRRCQKCMQKESRDYQRSPEGQAALQIRMELGKVYASHDKYRKTERGQEVIAKLRKKYKQDGRYWRWQLESKARRYVNRDTLKKEYWNDCDNCPENLNGDGSYSCAVAHGSEDITLCPVWQEWKHSGIHPLYKYDESEEV